MTKSKQKRIALVAVKGGTGKTTTAGAIAQAATKDGKDVLCIDLDPQCSLSIWYGADPMKAGAVDIIQNGADINAVIQHTDIGDIVSGNADLMAITTRAGSAKRLNNAIEPVIKMYDIIIIDTAPALGELQNNALYTATDIITPLVTDSSNLQAFYQTSDIVTLAKKQRPDIKHGIVITDYDGRPNLSRQMLDIIKNAGEKRNTPVLGVIRHGVAIREALSTCQDIYDYAPRSKPAKDYKDLYKKIMEL